MNAINFIDSAIFEVNRSFVNEVEPLTEKQMFFRPTTEANSISFLIWHFPRVEDNVFHRISTVDGTESVWQRDKWYEKFGVPANEDQEKLN